MGLQWGEKRRRNALTPLSPSRARSLSPGRLGVRPAAHFSKIDVFFIFCEKVNDSARGAFPQLFTCVSVRFSFFFLVVYYLLSLPDADSEKLCLASQASSGPACAYRTRLWSALCPRTPALLDRRGTLASPLLAPTFESSRGSADARVRSSRPPLLQRERVASR